MQLEFQSKVHELLQNLFKLPDSFSTFELPSSISSCSWQNCIVITCFLFLVICSFFALFRRLLILVTLLAYMGTSVSDLAYQWLIKLFGMAVCILKVTNDMTMIFSSFSAFKTRCRFEGNLTQVRNTLQNLVHNLLKPRWEVLHLECLWNL